MNSNSILVNAFMIILVSVLLFPNHCLSKEYQDATKLDLEDLMDMEVTTAARKSQTLSETASSVFVLTSEDIRRSAAVSIIDVLRIVPGITVARIDSNKWSISMRGFNGRFTNKLLVMKDNRSLYSPIFSGVFWETQDFPLEDIERIEIIRGPGATMWGANAVNGIINIITKSSQKLEKGLSAGGGNEEKKRGYAKYSGKISNDTTYSLSGKYSEKSDGASPYLDVDDNWTSTNGSLNIDMVKDKLKFNIIANLFNSQLNEASYTMIQTPPYMGIQNDHIAHYGQSVLARIDFNTANDSELSIQGYYSNEERNSRTSQFRSRISDFEFKYLFPYFYRNTIMAGAGARFMSDSIDSVNPVYNFSPHSDDYNLYNAFIQDEINLIDDRLFLIIGAKEEKNDYSGYEFQPSARILLRPQENTSLWCSASRAVRTPSRGEDAAIFLIGSSGIPPIPTILYGNKNLRSEKLISYEIGIRHSFSSKHALDLSGFYNNYYKLRTIELLNPPNSLTIGNNIKGHSKGFDLFYEFRPYDSWLISAGYSFLMMDLKNTSGSFDNSADILENSDPRHTLTLRSSNELFENIELDLWVRYVDQINSYDISGYLNADARIGWKISPSLTLSIIGRNLLDDIHPEYPPEVLETIQTEVERSFFIKLDWTN